MDGSFITISMLLKGLFSMIIGSSGGEGLSADAKAEKMTAEGSHSA